MNVFFDTNVMLDVLRDREPFAEPAKRTWMLAEQGRIIGLVSTLSLANIFYIIRRFADAETARSSLHLLRAIFRPVTCDAAVLDQALAANFPDFEDAIQFFSARQAGADCILTRDTGHFREASLPVLTPDQFLATHRFQ
jgi:predicted nucleic acid-binding protein